MTKIHHYTIHKCMVHKLIKPAYYFKCSCGVHSQCYTSKILCRKVAKWHVPPA